jgi:membrane protease subunit (stomatin/prohibitin family)
MLFKAENEFISIEVKKYGAELSSFKSKETNIEYLWQGNPDVWYGQSPILFPIVGQILENKFRSEGKEYEMAKHGIARKRNFELKEQGNDYIILTQSWNEARGIGIFTITIGMMDADEKSQQKILKYQEARGYADPTMLGTYIGMGQTDALNTAAGNTAGAVTGFAGYGMVGGVAGGGLNVANLMQQGAQQQQYQAAQQQVNQAPAQDTWKCSCGSVNTGKFCPNCGQPKPEAAGLKFCPECGQPFADPANPPKFCPNCGTKIG